jgi:hypothetical protein
MTEPEHVLWGLRRPDDVVEIMASECLARREAAREGGALIYRLGASPWRLASPPSAAA